MRESGENPEHYPLLYAREAAVRNVSWSLGPEGPEKAERRPQGDKLPGSARVRRPMMIEAEERESADGEGMRGNSRP